MLSGKRTRLFEHLLLGLHQGAEAVEHQRPQLGGAALRGLVVIQRVVVQDEPAFLQLQRGALPPRRHLLLQPAYRSKERNEEVPGWCGDA